jgi:hypothetical protein
MNCRKLRVVLFYCIRFQHESILFRLPIIYVQLTVISGNEFLKDNLHRITILNSIISVCQLKWSLRIFVTASLQFSVAAILLSSNPNLQFGMTLVLFLSL